MVKRGSNAYGKVLKARGTGVWNVISQTCIQLSPVCPPFTNIPFHARGMRVGVGGGGCLPRPGSQTEMKGPGAEEKVIKRFSLCFIE